MLTTFRPNREPVEPADEGVTPVSGDVQGAGHLRERDAAEGSEALEAGSREGERAKRELYFVEPSFRLHDGLRQSESAVASMGGPEEAGAQVLGAVGRRGDRLAPRCRCRRRRRGSRARGQSERRLAPAVMTANPTGNEEGVDEGEHEPNENRVAPRGTADRRGRGRDIGEARPRGPSNRPGLTGVVLYSSALFWERRRQCFPTRR